MGLKSNAGNRGVGNAEPGGVQDFAAYVDNFFVFDVVEESNDYATEEQRTNVDRSYDAEKVLVGEQALFETFVQEVGMEHNNLVDCLDLL